MKTYGFQVAHGYVSMKCCANASGEREIIEAVKNGNFEALNGYDCIDEYDLDDFTEGYELTDIWE